MIDDSKRRRAAHLGRLAETAAADHLHGLGYILLERNLRVGALELDIVARDGQVVVVVEVRYRGSGAWSKALASIGPRKRERLRRAARLLWTRSFAADPTIQRLRFDVIAVTFAPSGEPVLEHVRAAFR
jgi:putative endonuclease